MDRNKEKDVAMFIASAAWDMTRGVWDSLAIQTDLSKTAVGALFGIVAVI